MNKKHQQKQEDTTQQSQGASVSPSDEKNAEAEVWRQKYLRALADYQNLERRIANQREEDQKTVGSVIFKKLLPTVDALEKAHIHIKDEGLSLTIKQLLSTLQSLGVEHIEVLGKEFDPHMMECVETGGGGSTVVEVVHSGYTYNGRLLRPAKVKVGTKPEEGNKSINNID